MDGKIYVGNLNYRTTSEELAKFFKGCGLNIDEESIKIITDKQTGRGKGFAFIGGLSREEVQQAIDNGNSKELDERRLVVREARGKDD